MKRRLIVSCFLGLFFISSQAYSNSSTGIHEKHPYTFSIQKHVYKFSELYQINSLQKETYPGTVKKSAFRIRTNYDLSDEHGWQATGITRVISLGVLYPWARDIDVYDTRGVQIGMIDGNMATLESAKFNIYEYDDEGNSTQVGIAYASSNFEHFAIVPSMSDPHPIAEFNRNYSDNSWKVTVNDPDKIDDRMVRIFAGFVIDFEDAFLAKQVTGNQGQEV